MENKNTKMSDFFLIQYMKADKVGSVLSIFGITTLEEVTVNTLDYFHIQSLFTPALVGAKDEKKSISFPWGDMCILPNNLLWTVYT